MASFMKKQTFCCRGHVPPHDPLGTCHVESVGIFLGVLADESPLFNISDFILKARDRRWYHYCLASFRLGSKVFSAPDNFLGVLDFILWKIGWSKWGDCLFGNLHIDVVVDICFWKKLFDVDVRVEGLSVFLFKNLQKYGVILYYLLFFIHWKLETYKIFEEKLQVIKKKITSVLF